MLRKILLAIVFIELLHSNSSAGDKPPPGKYIEVEIEPDTGKAATPPLFIDEAKLKAFQKWRYQPKNARRVKIPMMYSPIPPTVPSGPTVI